jgi:phosphoribosylglycinamide formyltransferase 1
MTKRVAILISGSGSNMVALAQSMTGAHPARPCLVLSNDPSASGLDKARAMGIPVAAVDHKPFRGDRAAFEAALLEPLLAAQPDIIALAGFMRVLTADFVRRFQGQMLNIHPSLLPKYKGLNTHARAISDGEHTAGCTVHLVTAELDDGPILGQACVPILANDTADTLAARVLPMEHRLYPKVMERFARGETGLITLP